MHENSPDTKLTLEFLDFLNPSSTFEFHIDWRRIDSDSAAVYGITRDVEPRLGTFQENEEYLIRWNNRGANIQVSLENTNAVYTRVQRDSIVISKLPIQPSFTILLSSQFEMLYWKIDAQLPDEKNQLQLRLANQFNGDISTCEPNVLHFLPGFIRHPSIIMAERFSVRPRDGSPWFDREKKPKSTTLKKLSETIAALPSKSPVDRVRDIAERISPEIVAYPTEEVEPCEHIEKIADLCVRRGYNFNDIVNLCLDVNSKLLWQTDENEITGWCYSIQNEKNRENGIAGVGSDFQPMFSIKSARIDNFIDKEPPVREWVFTGCLPLGKAGLLVAKGGTGKSQFALQLGISVATGETFIQGWPVGKAGKCLVLAAEDETEELHRRIRESSRVLAENSPDAVEFNKRLRENLFVKSLVGMNNLMTTTEWSKEVTETDFREKLTNTILGIGRVRLIIIDPASRFRGGQENSAEDTTRFVETIERLVQSTGATVLVIHHTNKWSGGSTEAMQEASRGSSALTDGVRWQMNIATMNTTEAKEFGIIEDDRRFYLTAQVTKNNYAPPQPKMILKRGEHGVLSCVDLTTAKNKKTVDVLGRVVDLVASEAKRGATYSKTKFEALFGGTSNTLNIGKVALRKLLDEALEAGKLKLHDRKLALPGKTIPHARINLTNPKSDV